MNTDVRTVSEAAERAEAIRRIVDQAPPLTDEQRARIADLLPPVTYQPDAEDVETPGRAA